MSYTIGILGLGTFGSTIAKTLSKYNCDIIAVDDHDYQVNQLEAILSRGIIGDITDKDLLRAAGIDSCDAVVVATGENLESSVLAVLHCKSLGVETVIAKVKSKTMSEVLLKIGADKVISPERETGVSIAKQLLHRYTTEVIELDDKTSIIEFRPPESWIGKSLVQLKLRQKYLMNIIAYRDMLTKELNIQVMPEYVFNTEETIVAVATNDLVDHFEEFTNRMS
ncbi:potassium channel family protein [Streptococcus sp. DD13]|uniref:potassium channel family protein n=1 Tax=Streptococcus sp. DD13 TaxID=1777881 RepID=UPI000797F67D|nr:TrkA family potassium uptake protein [Streptococcus sp. DD13]KXT78224.1 Potassium uptake protein, integral membrane component, KtrA [Streptococcus sp. DD13]